MTGMNVWKRATLAIVRKPVRSGIIGLLMLMVFTSLVAQVGASTALQKMSDDIGGSLGMGFTVDTGENPVSPKEASRFSRIPGVGKTVYERKTLAQVDGAHPVVPEHGPRLDSGLSTQVSVLGTTDSSLSEEFQSGLYRLEQGHHISGNGRNVLIHRDFARENGLSVGSTFRLSQEGRDSTVRVAGIFSGNVQAQSPMPSDASENLIYSGAQVVSALTGEERSARSGASRIIRGIFPPQWPKQRKSPEASMASPMTRRGFPACCSRWKRCAIWSAWCCCPSAWPMCWYWAWRLSSGSAHASMR